MKRIFLSFFLTAIFVSFAYFSYNHFKTNSSRNYYLNNSVTTLSTEKTTLPETESLTDFIRLLKDVGEAYMENFGLDEKDFSVIRNSGFDVIEGNFDICADDLEVQYFLDGAEKYGLQVILNAGSGEAEWGYSCDENYHENQKPVWQKEKVTAWVQRWKNHPAIYAWDISNEAGGNFPNASKGFYLTSWQLKTAYSDVKKADPDHPIIIRMNGWIFYENESNFFGVDNPYAKGVADIVMVNAYSNVEDYYPNFVEKVLTKAIDSINQIDKNVKIIPALGVWNEPPLWITPSIENFNNDYRAVQKYSAQLLGVSYFKYGAMGSEWYFPTSSPALWAEIGRMNLLNP